MLCANQGETVVVNLTNTLSEATSIIFPGQAGVSPAGGSPGLLTAEAAASGGTVSYSFTASEPGTYLYQSGTDQAKQVEMGLYGAIVIRPTEGDQFAYNAPRTEFNTAREHLLLLSEIDPDLHRAVEKGTTFDETARHPRYFLINGRGFPDVISDNFVSWLPNQPYGALVTVQPFDPAAIGGNQLPAMVRYANAGLDNHPFHPHANHLLVIARDGRLLEGPAGEDASYENFTRTVGSGQTIDLLFRWEDDEHYKPNPTSARVPVAFPSYRNLQFSEATFYSGSPYLGYKGTLPTVVTKLSVCGEYYFPWHSHNLVEIVNFDEAFGGMMTLLRVDPPGGALFTAPNTPCS